MFRRKQYQASFGITTWYDALKEHTFRTVHVSISIDEGNAIVTLHQAFQKEKHKKLDIYRELTQAKIDEAKRVVAQVEARLTDALVAFPKGAFVKLNTRSPKDVPIEEEDNPDVMAKVDAEMPPVGQRTQDAVSAAYVRNHHSRSQLILIEVIGTNKCLKITTAKQAIYLLTRSTRISEDIGKMLPYAKYFETSIVIREYLDEAPARIAYEFRGFACKNQLNALTQYFDFIYCKELHENKDAIGQRVLDFFYSVNKRIPHESYVIDFLVLQDRILIIELNPFHNGAGASLFSWGTEPNPKSGVDLLPKRWAKLIEYPPGSKEAAETQTQPESSGPGCRVM